jgi:hypothetical protein
MTQLISELYLKQNEQLKSLLKEKDFFSITTDGWSSKKKKKSIYISYNSLFRS